MFKVLDETFGCITDGISAVRDLVAAGKSQTEIIKDASAFDADKKRAKLTAELAAYQKELAKLPKPKK